jgi:isoleucyl-tRNA synthetase
MRTSHTPPAAREQALLDLWNERSVFARTQEAGPDSKPFVFFEGPPTANGRPHIAHVIPRALKDLFTRFQSMQGRTVVRKAGWDTHGLPVELEVEKQLGLSGKPQVEAYGVAAFNARCRESVWKYKSDWEQNATERLGYWVDTADPYVTCADSYVESVWWAMRQMWDKSLVYHGHKVLPYCPRCGTALSSHEVAQGYQDVEDPALWVRFPVTTPGRFQGASLLAWTTTPWTLPANLALAVHPEARYALATVDGERVIAMSDRLPAGALVEAEFPGAELAGLRYDPPFGFSGYDQHQVLTAPWVTVDDGSGVVHIAPAFGEDDARLGAQYGLPHFCPVDDQGRYTAAVAPWQGTFVKKADPLVTAALAEKGRLFRAEKVRHAYPFCWRCDTPLLYMARGAWFVRTTAYQAELLAANNTVTWYPDHFRAGRFGQFLENLIDWCVSRERYWGTPMPLWRCACGHDHMVGSVAELRAMSAEPLGPEPDLHRPGIDRVELVCPACGGRMRRVPEVLDCWFDAGCMPFAQHHYPFENEDLFRRQFPADFICEAVDQTRGWFYVLLAVSVAIFGQAPYRTVLVTELGLDEKGKKMSKSRGNVVPLGQVLDQYGADTLRFYVYSSGQPWFPKRFGHALIAEAGRVLDTLRNVQSFFTLYAGLDGWQPEPPGAGLSDLDRWLLSRLQGVMAAVREALLAYDVAAAARELTAWIDDLSNWYVRLSRRRFWAGGEAGRPAFATLRHALWETARLMAPFTPFLAESLYQALGGGDSVHLERYPEPDPSRVDLALEERMAAVRRYVSAGRAARQKAGLKVRQPLAAVALLGAADVGGLADLLAAELNVKAVLLASELPPDFVEGEDAGCRAAVDPRLTPELRQEGLAREVVNRLQRYRKELGLAVEDRVELWVDGSPALVRAVQEHSGYVAGEVQAVRVHVSEALPPGVDPLRVSFEGEELLSAVVVA